ncbi:MAG: hypothetical protein FJX53_12540 [Alphaproteobacteria bacterium]|nr:hypothetical protein [Alphaproteobacteria bacterium]
MTPVITAMAGLAATLLCVAAAAQDAQEMPPPPAADTVRAVVRVHAGASFGDGACVDLGDTPACAAETWLACLWRADPALCVRLGMADIRFPPVAGRRRREPVSSSACC